MSGHEKKREGAFWSALTVELLSDSHNLFLDNIDHIRFPEQTTAPMLRKVKDKALQAAARLGLSQHLFIDYSKVTEILSLPGLNETYLLLEDGYSRDLFVKLLAFRILGPRKVRLPTNSPLYWDKVHDARRYRSKENVIGDIHVLGSLDLYNVGDIRLIGHQLSVVNTFLLEQYRSDRAGVRVGDGDVIIDAGGCWGDTAMYFAQRGAHVYCYECIPSNLEILRKNLDLNPRLAEKISVISKALYSEPAKLLTFSDTGPGSHITSQGVQIETDSIDNLVCTNGLSRIDFIKMDIEGGEMGALIGAEQAIRSFRPRLAISLYHSLEDFVRIPEWIASLHLGYQFYLDHFTIHQEETVLFAIAGSR